MVRSRPRSKKGHQNAPKSAPSWPSWPPSWPSWAHLGAKLANLAPSWPILAPRCAPTDLQIEPQTRPKSHLRPSWRQEGRPGAPNHPWSSNFQGFDPNFDSIFDPIFEHIFIIFLRFLLQFPAAGLARWRLCARSALDIYIYIYIYIYI